MRKLGLLPSVVMVLLVGCGGPPGVPQDGGSSGTGGVGGSSGAVNQLWNPKANPGGYPIGIAIDQAGNIVIAGDFFSLQPAVGFYAAILKYDATGILVWQRYLDVSATGREIEDIALGPDGSISIVGQTAEPFPGETLHVTPGAAGNVDVFVGRYSAQGDKMWVHEFGAPSGPANVTGIVNSATGVVVDSNGNTYACGNTAGTLPDQALPNGSFLVKYDVDGNNKWTRQFVNDNGVGDGPQGDATDVGVDGGNDIYVLGKASFVSGAINRFSPDGTIVKTDVYDNLANSVTRNAIFVTTAGIFFTGTNFSSTRAVNPPFLAVAGADGTLITEDDITSTPVVGAPLLLPTINDTATSATGSATYLTGAISGVLPGESFIGDPSDQATPNMFVMRYDRTGTRTWAHQYGAGTGGGAHLSHVAMGPDDLPFILVWPRGPGNSWMVSRLNPDNGVLLDVP